MDNIINGAFELLAEAIKTESAFVLFSVMIGSIQGIAIYYLIVMNANRMIAFKRKDYGMRQVDQAVINIKKIIISHYYKLAEEKLGDDYFNVMETELYRNLVTSALEERRDRFRARIRQNGFEKKSPSAWSKYVEESIKEDFEAITAFMDEHYHAHALIPRPELYTHNEPALINIKRELCDLLQYLLDLATENKFKKFFRKEIQSGSY